jgi:hypothetical protein
MSPAPIKPMLGDLELSLVQRARTAEERALAKHVVPGLDGAVFQNMGRRPTRVVLTGVLVGEDSLDGLTELRQKFQVREPVSFVADIATGTQITQVLIEHLRVKELAGRPAHFGYRVVLREFVSPPPSAPTVSPDALGPFGDLVDAIEAMGSIPDFGDPTPPLLRALDDFETATEGLSGVLGALSDKIGTPPDS